VSDRLRDLLPADLEQRCDALDNRIARMAWLADDGRKAGRSHRLSPRECDVFALLMLGSTSQEIGATFGLTRTSVEQYVSSVIRKLGARNRIHAVSRLFALAAEKAEG
jgi:DNA-binding NarL/FixJ family response regulator